jgi:hypothetical protein
MLVAVAAQFRRGARRRHLDHRVSALGSVAGKPLIGLIPDARQCFGTSCAREMIPSITADLASA